MKYKTWLPLFSGFYNTIWADNGEDTQAISNINDRRREIGLPAYDVNLDYDDFTFDYKMYYLDYAKEITNKILGELIQLGVIRGGKFEELVSPQFYNYGNDSINIEVDIVANKLSSYAKTKEFNEYAKKSVGETYKPCSGFIPRYSQYWSDWLEDTNNMRNFDCDTHKLGAILELILEFENVTEDHIYDFAEQPCLDIENFDEMLYNYKCPVCGEVTNFYEEYEAECRKARSKFSGCTLYSFKMWLEKQTLECCGELIPLHIDNDDNWTFNG